MALRTFSRGFTVATIVALAAVALAAVTASAGIYVPPAGVTGTTPSGLQWSAVATGTALPVRTTGTNPLNGAPGAVVYVDVTTGQVQFNPNGLNVSNFVLTYTTGTTNVTAASPGPFTYATGTDGLAAISTPTGPQLTFPAFSTTPGTPPTVQAARVGAAIGPPLSAALATSGNAGNVASTNGWWNQGWAFPSDLIASGSLSAVAATFTSGSGSNYFRTTGNAANLNANILGFGSQQGVFLYSINGASGNQLGAVVPVPEPSTVVLAGVGLAAACGLQWRRKARRQKNA